MTLVRAHWAVWHRSPARRLVWAAVAISGVSGLLHVATSARPTWFGLLAWQNLWVTFAGPMLTAVIVATMAETDRRSRGGGTWFRGLPPLGVRAARTVVAGAHVAAAQVLAFGVPVLLGVVVGASGSDPIARVGTAIVVCAVSQLALVAVAERCARSLGRAVAIAVGMVWSVVAVLGAESPLWWANPAAWTLRGSLPLINTHANGIALDPAAPLASVSPWPSTLLALLLAIVVTAVPLPTPVGLPGRRGSRAPADRAVSDRPLRRSVQRAVATVLVRTWLPVLSLLAVAGTLIFLRWQEPVGVLETFGLIVLPWGASLLPIIAWPALSPGWRVLACRSSRTDRPLLVALALLFGVHGVVFLAVHGALVLVGLPFDAALGSLPPTAVTGGMLVSLCLWLVIRWGVAVALMVTTAGGLVGVLAGGSQLGDLLWWVSPWSWAVHVEPARMAVTIPLGVLITAGCTVLGLRSARRAAAT